MVKILISPKKTVLITSLGLLFIGSVYTALRLYYRNKRIKAAAAAATAKNKQRKLTNGTLLGGKRPVSANQQSTGKLSNRPYSSDYDLVATVGSSKQTTQRQPSTSSCSTGIRPLVTERSILFATLCAQDDIKNFPAEELLELGMNYLSQAIKSWETALDSIESAAYMQSQTLALPTDEHADLVFKLRTLLDKANDISLNCTNKLIKSSQTLQIIQSRLAYKQQLYADALLHKSNTTATATATSIPTTSNQAGNSKLDEEQSRPQTPSVLAGSLNKRFGSYFSGDEDDNESFVSADSDFDWLDKDLFERIENVDDKNALYEMALSNVNLGRVSYRVSRASLLDCKSENDFAAKLHAIRLGFDRLLQDTIKKEWFIEQGSQLIKALLGRADKDPTGLLKNYNEFIRFVMIDGDWKLIKDELATRDVFCMNFYDIVLDFILLDAFEDLDNPPSAIQAVIQNTWLSQSFKETALSTAVWSVLKAKRRILKYPNGFMSRFYSVNEYLVPVLAWGFLGTDTQLTQSFVFMKSHIVEYLKCIFDMERTRLTNLDELSADLEAHSIKYLKEIIDHIELVK